MIISTKPRDLLLVLFRQKWRITVIFVAVNAIAVGYLLTAQPLYEAKADLLIRFGDEAPAQLTQNMQQTQLVPDERREILLTNIEIIQSQELLKQILNEFGIAKVYPKMHPPLTGTLEDKALKQLAEDLTVKAGQEDNAIQISLLNASPELATAMESRLIDLYQAKESRLYTPTPTSFLSNELKSAQDRSTTSQAALQAFKSENGVSDFDGEVNSLLTNRQLAVSAVSDAQSAKAQAVRREAEFRSALAQVPAEAAGSNGETYRQVDDIGTKLNTLKLSLAQYQPGSDMARQLQDQINILQAQLNDEKRSAARRGPPNIVYQTLQTNIMSAHADASAADEAIAAAQAHLDQLETRLRALEAVRPDYDALVRQADLDVDAYKAIAARLQEGRIADQLVSSKLTRVSVFDPPSTAMKPARPRVALTVIAGFLSSLLLALGVAFFRESMDERFATPEQLSYALKLPNFGSFSRRQS